MYNYGDIVKPKFNAGGIEYYIVIDVNDFSREGDGSEMAYDIMRIYPVQKTSFLTSSVERRLERIASAGTKEAKMMVDYVYEHRHKRGWTDKPDFEIALDGNKKFAEDLKEAHRLDIIRYDKILDIDGCLDAMNDLKRLHKMFGDEAYLQLREFAEKRLIEITSKK